MSEDEAESRGYVPITEEQLSKLSELPPEERVEALRAMVSKGPGVILQVKGEPAQVHSLERAQEALAGVERSVSLTEAQRGALRRLQASQTPEGAKANRHERRKRLAQARKGRRRRNRG